MKKLILISLLLVSLSSFSQVVCPVHIPHFDFYFNTPVIQNQKVGGVSYCEPDTLQSDVWSIQDPLNVFVINQSGDILVSDPIAINANGTFIYNLMVKITDNGTPPMENFSTVSLYATKPNEPPVILPQ